MSRVRFINRLLIVFLALKGKRVLINIEKMITLQSYTKKRRKYFFEGFKFGQKSIEEGHAHPDAAGKLLSSLEVSLDSFPDLHYNQELRKILKDCCPPEIENRGVKSCINYIEAFSPDGKMYKVENKIYVHTIQSESGKESSDEY